MVDKVRASRDGHEFHELWIARLALGLITHQNNLIGIAIEGVSPKEKNQKNKELVEIADAILFYGGCPTFESAHKSRIVQVKYSISSANVDYRNSHAKKTISKFAASYKDLVKRFGEENLKSKITFEIVTNRPIYEHFASAIKLIGDNKKISGESKTQADQFKKACGLQGKHLRLFAKLFILNGNEQNLPANLKSLNRTISNWSSTNGVQAKARAGNIKQLIRSKAGSKGEKNNLIEKTDILAELDLESEEDLLPCPPFLNKIENLVPRDCFNEVAQIIRQKDSPILISAAGGVGKSVLLKSLEVTLSNEYLTTIFDCFGGGAYRSPEDARHLPRKGLTHIVNTFSCQGLCDPLIPADSSTTDALLKTFRSRIIQVVTTIRSSGNKKGVVIFLDAIDNSQTAANDSSQDCFPTLLLKSIQHSGNIDGLKVVSTCRDHRKPENFDNFFTEVSLAPFTIEETSTFLNTRKPELSDTQINVAFSRSAGNPRVLDHIVQSDEAIFNAEKINNTISVDELINLKIEHALNQAKLQGSTSQEIELFLTGLCVLPPPVPIDEYSNACGVPTTAISSFASDLAPLLDRFGDGIVFRDEPTETYVRDKFEKNVEVLGSVANNLDAAQEESAYATRALPHLLTKLGDQEKLYGLAFSGLFPASITSKVGIQRVRKARITSALQFALKKSDHDRILPLLIELSTVSTSNSRIQNYLADYPELVYESGDTESIRNLLETKTPWPGKRFASSCVIQALNDEFEESDRNRSRLYEWLKHHYSRDQDEEQSTPKPTILDAATVAFSYFSQGRISEALVYLSGWRHWYGHDVTTRLIQLLTHRDYDKCKLIKMLAGELGVITAFLEHGGFSTRAKTHLIKKLSEQCDKGIEDILDAEDHNNRLNSFGYSLLQAAAYALQKDLKKNARKILSAISPKRYAKWNFDNRDWHNTYARDYVFPFFLYATLSSNAKGEPLDMKALLSQELFEICNQVKRSKNQQSYATRLKVRLEEYVTSNENVREDGLPKISEEKKKTLNKHIDSDLTKLALLANAFLLAITSKSRNSLRALESLLECCSSIVSHQDRYGRKTKNNLFTTLVFECILFLLSMQTNYTHQHGQRILKWCLDQDILTPHRRRALAESMAKNESLHEIAATQANLASKQISQTDTDIDTRANFFGSIALILNQIDTKESVQHFRKGLVQLDSLGSGDYEYISELLNLIGTIDTDEMEPDTFHTLSNLVEINIAYEPEKFGWYSFSNAFSNIAGLPMLAKLARWHDRKTVCLGITLLPYLVSLLERKKISPEIAIALNYLDDPYELHVCNSIHFINQIAKDFGERSKPLVDSALQQYLISNPTLSNYRSLKEIIEEQKEHIAKPVLDHLSNATKKLTIIGQASHKRQETKNQQSFVRAVDKNIDTVVDVKKLSKKTAPLKVDEIHKSIEVIDKLQGRRKDTTLFFSHLRARVQYADRYQYLDTLASLNCIGVYQKLDELDNCLKLWASSSSSLSEDRKKLLIPILELNLEDMFSWNRVYRSNFEKISSITSVPIDQLAIKVALICLEKDIELSGAEWLGLAELVVERTSKNVANDRITVIAALNSEALESTFPERAPSKEYYPENDETLVAANLIFSQLGSPNHQERWHACHSICYLARANRWDVIAQLIKLYETNLLSSFTSEGLKVYTFHSRLWLLIALNRISLEMPKNISKYKKFLVSILNDSKSSHSIINHFATETILHCSRSGFLKCSKKLQEKIHSVKHSIFSPLDAYDEQVREKQYASREAGYEEPENYFHVGYEFNKNEVSGLSRTFGVPKWQVSDAISNKVRLMDSSVKYQRDYGGREFYSHSEDKDHTYGEYLSWHALHQVAADLLTTNPTLKDDYEPNGRWADWMKRFTLSNEHSLWASDGIDVMPYDIPIELLEYKGGSSRLTNKREIFLNLLLEHDSELDGYVIDGNWYSRDQVKVRISSALISNNNKKSMAKALSTEGGFKAYLPKIGVYEGIEENLSMNEKVGFIPWVCYQEIDERIDIDDPFGDRLAYQRPLFSQSISLSLGIYTKDPFKRFWLNKNQKRVALGQAWMGTKVNYRDAKPLGGKRLIIDKNTLKKLLKSQKKKLVILFELNRHIESGDGKGFYASTATCSIDENLKTIFHKGASNEKLDTSW
ncbi:MAG: hypothetical protein ACRBEE_15665 [Arenicella sp.]